MKASDLTAYASRALLRGLRRSGNEGLRAEIARFVMENRFPVDLAPELPIEVTCDDSTLRELWARVRDAWERLGKDEPYWSVCTADSFKQSNFRRNEKEFWDSGQFITGRMKDWAGRNGIACRPDWVCLEYGCGTGRTTRWLCQDFQSVIACDISAPHLALARGALDRFGCKNVEFLQVSTLDLLDRRPPVDLLFSMLVLQHNPPPVIAYVLDHLLGKLNPGGIAFLQVPTFDPAYSFGVREYLDAAEHPKIEMHVLPQRHVFQIAAKQDCEIVEAQPDNWTSNLAAVSTTFLMRKRITRIIPNDIAPSPP